MLGLWLFAGLLVLALVLRLPGRVAFAMTACLWLGIVLLLAVAPESAPARAIGGDVRHWLLGGGIAGLIFVYRLALRRLRAVAPAANYAAPADSGTMSDVELDRYARHLVLREIGGPGQMRLRKAKVLVVGAGGLGSPVCQYLAAAGVGSIHVADDDRVTLSNLQRQVIFRDDQLGKYKAQAASENMAHLNPHVGLYPLICKIDRWGGQMGRDVVYFSFYDLVIDGTDNFTTREAVNQGCVEAGIPLISGAIAQWEGQVALYDPARGGPCFSCMFPQAPAPGLAPACAEAGVVGALPGVIGSIMALEAIKHLTHAGQGLRERMLNFDGLYGETRMISTTANKGCTVCNGVGADRDTQ